MKLGMFSSKMTLKVVALAMVVASAVQLEAHTHELCEGFVPENTMQIPVGQKATGRFADLGPGLTEQQFNAAIDRAEKLYADVIAQKGGRLQFNRRWTDPTVNASAQRMGTTYVVNMYGGLARHSTINMEGFMLVVCHELGHHIGGAPKLSGWWGDDWATNEGGSDYFATLKCLRRMFAEDDNKAITDAATIDPVARERCMTEFTAEDQRLICLRNSMAAESVAYLFMDLRKEAKKPMFNTPDPKVVDKMLDAHPPTQCRMDTYFAGASCNVDHTIDVSDSDYKQGACAAPAQTVGTRPLCWFKP